MTGKDLQVSGETIKIDSKRVRFLRIHLDSDEIVEVSGDKILAIGDWSSSYLEPPLVSKGTQALRQPDVGPEGFWVPRIFFFSIPRNGEQNDLEGTVSHEQDATSL